MNSFILSAVATFFKSFVGMLRKSGVYALFMKIYNSISSAWKNSSIISFISNKKNDDRSVNSITAKVLYSPFRFIEILRSKIGEFIEKNIAESVICDLAKTYLHNFMAVNTRFFGIMILTTVIIYCIANMNFSKIAAIVGAVGAVMCIFNFNLMGFLNPSKVINFLKNAAGFENLDFEFYAEERTKGKTRLVIALVTGIVTGVAMSVNMLYGMAIPFGIFGIPLVLYAPIVGVYIAVFSAPFLPTMALAGLCILTMFSLVIKYMTDKNYGFKFEGTGILILLFLAVLFVSCVFSFARGESLMVWAMYLVFAGFYFAILNTVKTKEQLYGLFKLLVISGALVALYGIMQYLFGWTTSNAWIDEEMFEDATMRVYSTLGNPNVLGEYLLLVLPVAAVYMLKYQWKRISKWAYIAMFAVLALCLVLTQSRGCWIGFMVSVAIFVTFYEGKIWVLIPIVLCILPFVLPQTIIDRVLSIGDMDDSSTSYRVYIWMGTLGMIKHYWLGGIGMGEAAYSQVYPFFSYNAIVAPHSHNLYLQLLVEAGISGLLIFVIMQVVFAKKMSIVYKLGDKKSTDSMLALAISSGVIGFLAQSMFDYTFYNYRVMAIFFMIMAMGMALKTIKEREVQKK